MYLASEENGLVDNDGYGSVFRQEMHAASQVAEHILEDVEPELASQLQVANNGSEFAEIASRALALLKNLQDLEEKLGPRGPRLAAGSLHSSVWDSAAPWGVEQYAESVDVAARTVNALLQDRVGRRDHSETELVRRAFSTNDPPPDGPRLRFPDVDPDEDPRTWESLHRGAMKFGAGCFSAIRNPLAHRRPEDELDKQEALEYLAAFSVLARWLDRSERTS